MPKRINERTWKEVEILRKEGYSQIAIAKLLAISISSINRKYGEKWYELGVVPKLDSWYLNMVGGETKIRVSKQGELIRPSAYRIIQRGIIENKTNNQILKDLRIGFPGATENREHRIEMIEFQRS